MKEIILLYSDQKHGNVNRVEVTTEHAY